MLFARGGDGAASASASTRCGEQPHTRRASGMPPRSVSPSSRLRGRGRQPSPERVDEERLGEPRSHPTAGASSRCPRRGRSGTSARTPAYELGSVPGEVLVHVDAHDDQAAFAVPARGVLEQRRLVAGDGPHQDAQKLEMSRGLARGTRRGSALPSPSRRGSVKSGALRGLALPPRPRRRWRSRFRMRDLPDQQREQADDKRDGQRLRTEEETGGYIL